MKIEKIKDVPIGEKTYQIGKIASDDGSYLLFKAMEALRKLMQSESDGTEQSTPTVEEQTEEQRIEAAESVANIAIQSMLTNADRKLFAEVQKLALGVCGEYKMVGTEEAVVPVLRADGRFNDFKLSTDIQTVAKLTSQALLANLTPFFLNGGFGDTKEQKQIS